MGRYFEGMPEEREKEIMQALIDKYGPMSLSELDEAFRGKPQEIESKDMTGISFEPVTASKPDWIGLDEDGNWESAYKIDKHWKLKSNKMENAGKNSVTETEASALLNRLCHIDDVAHGNRVISNDVRVRLFGIEPQDDPEIDSPEAKAESWFALVNSKLNSIQDALRDTGHNLERINGGTQF